MLDGLTSSSRIKTYEIHVNAFIAVKVLGGISFHVLAENWKHLKDALVFHPFMCVRIKIDS